MAVRADGQPRLALTTTGAEVDSGAERERHVQNAGLGLLRDLIDETMLDTAHGHAALSGASALARSLLTMWLVAMLYTLKCSASRSA